MSIKILDIDRMLGNMTKEETIVLLKKVIDELETDEIIQAMKEKNFYCESE